MISKNEEKEATQQLKDRIIYLEKRLEEEKSARYKAQQTDTMQLRRLLKDVYDELKKEFDCGCDRFLCERHKHKLERVCHVCNVKVSNKDTQCPRCGNPELKPFPIPIQIRAVVSYHYGQVDRGWTIRRTEDIANLLEILEELKA